MIEKLDTYDARNIDYSIQLDPNHYNELANKINEIIGFLNKQKSMMKPSERIMEISKTKTYFDGNIMMQDGSPEAKISSILDYLDEMDKDESNNP